jgi:hypothetical protein
MPPVVRAYDLVDDLRTRAELLRQRQLENSILGLIRANQIQANSIILGIDGNVTVTPGTLTAGDTDTLIDFAPNTMTLGHAASLINIPPGSFEIGNAISLIDVPAGALSVGAEVLVPTSAITNTMLAPDSVTTSKVSANAIGANEIAANAIIAGKIAAGAVTAAKINVGTLDAIAVDMGTLTGGSIKLPGPTAVPRVEITATGIRTFAASEATDDAPSPQTLTFRSTTYHGNPITPWTIGQVKGNSPELIVGGQSMQVANTEVVTWGASKGTAGYVSTKMTCRNDNGDELGYVKIFLSGDGHVSGDWIGDSDRKLKKDIESVDSALDKIRKLTPRVYTRKKSGRREHGLIAQEVEAVVPEAVREHTVSHVREEGEWEHETVKGLSYNQISALTLAALQELSDDVDKLKAKVK